MGQLYEGALQPPNDEKAKEMYRDASRHAEDIREYDGVVPAELSLPPSASAAAFAAQNSTPPTLRETALLTLAQLHLRRSEAEECRLVCREITSSNPGCEAAALMLADLLFRQGESAAATYHYSTLLEQRPNAYPALARLITLLKRAGRIGDAQRFLNRAVRSRPSAESTDAGFRFCKGLFSAYNNDPHEAIRLLNTVRLTGAWGTQASYAMTWIYLSPDNDPLWLERGASGGSKKDAPPSSSTGGGAAGAGGTSPPSSPPSAPGGGGGSSSGEDTGSNVEALKVATRILEDVPVAQRGPMHTVLSSYVLMSYRTKSAVDEAVGKLEALLLSSPEYPPCLQALATAYMIQKADEKARNTVKRVLRATFDSELTDEWVRAYLLQADLCMAKDRLDQASESLKQAMKLDQSCARAYEYLGAISEREGRFGEAASYYEQAWKHENEASAPVGFKLAYNHLRAGRYVPAIDVCHKILAQYPDYPRIKAEVMDKARALLRT